MKVYLARHCESEYNVQKRLNSDPSVKVKLTEKGINQAYQLAESLKMVNFDIIYVSELYRTQQTAEIINKFHNKKIIIDSRLNDNKSGFEGRPISEYIRAIGSSDNGLSARFGDGESLQDVIERVKEFVKELNKTDYNECLIVTSGYIIECLYGISAKVAPDVASSFAVPQGEYSLLQI